MNVSPEVTCELEYRWPGTGMCVSYFTYNFYGKRRDEYLHKWYEYKDKNWLYNDRKKKIEDAEKDLDGVKKKN